MRVPSKINHEYTPRFLPPFEHLVPEAAPEHRKVSQQGPRWGGTGRQVGVLGKLFLVCAHPECGDGNDEQKRRYADDVQ